MKVARWEARRFKKSGPAGKRATFFVSIKVAGQVFVQKKTIFIA